MRSECHIEMGAVQQVQQKDQSVGHHMHQQLMQSTHVDLQ